jgi:hypothetical protein
MRNVKPKNVNDLVLAAKLEDLLLIRSLDLSGILDLDWIECQTFTRWFKTMPLLHSLKLRSCFQVARKVEYTLSREFVKIDQLDLGSNYLSDFALFCIELSGENLKVLCLENCFCIESEWNALFKLIVNSCPNLEEIDVSGNNFDSEYHVNALADVLQKCGLRKFSAKGCRVNLKQLLSHLFKGNNVMEEIDVREVYADSSIIPTLIKVCSFQKNLQILKIHIQRFNSISEIKPLVKCFTIHKSINIIDIIHPSEIQHHLYALSSMFFDMIIRNENIYEINDEFNKNSEISEILNERMMKYYRLNAQIALFACAKRQRNRAFMDFNVFEIVFAMLCN